MRVAPTRNVWIHESLEDEARQVGEVRGIAWMVSPPLVGRRVAQIGEQGTQVLVVAALYDSHFGPWGS